MAFTIASSALLAFALAAQAPPEAGPATGQPAVPPPPAEAPPSSESPPPADDAASTPPPSAPAPNTAELAELYKPRLARAWLREAGMILGSTGVSPDAFPISVSLTNRAVRWLADDAQAWRVAFEVGRMCEATADGRALRADAVAVLSRLDAADEVMQLLRLSDAVNANETAEARLSAYRRLLEPDVRARLGPRISSRLMFDQALLQNRAGDVDGFAKSLADALAIDPAFPAASELAAGFFAARSPDLVSAVELIVAAIVANPVKLDLYLDLAAILMAEGAYESAARIYRLAELVSATREIRERCDISCDRALALWGAGDPAAALRVVQIRIKEVDDNFFRFRQRIDPTFVVTDEFTRESPLTPMLALLQTVLSRIVADPKADKALERLERGIDQSISGLDTVKEEYRDQVIAGMADGLWSMLVLGGDVSRAEELLAKLEAARPLRPEATQRYEGWLLLRRGEMDAAIEKLRPISEDDNMARLGVAIALLSKEQSKDAAREFLAIANEERGTALGMYAGDRLFEIVKARPGPGEKAAALDAAVAALPSGFDRLIENSRGAIGLTVTPEKRVYSAFEPIRVTISVHNRTNLTLAIDPQGPIDARIAIELKMMMVGAQQRDLPTTIVPIDRRIELAPGESESVTIDLSYMSFGSLIGFNAVRGLSLELRVAVNFIANIPRVGLGFLGTEATSGIVRVDGVRTDEAWQERTWASMRSPDSLPDPAEFAMAGAWLAMREDVTSKMRMTEVAGQWADLSNAYRRYPPEVQAWLLMVMPNSMVGDAPLLDAARESADPMVIEAFLLRRARNPEDPIFDIARRTGDPYLIFLADSVHGAIVRRIETMQKEFGLGEKR